MENKVNIQLPVLKVSIIIPVYNLERYIGKTLQSCLEQTYCNLEIIVINDGSSDESERVIRSFMDDRRIILCNQENAGVSAARNRGIGMATGDYITFLDGDDTLSLDTIEKFVEVASRPGFDFKWIFFPMIRVLECGEEIEDLDRSLMPSYKYSDERVLNCSQAFDLMSSRKLPMCVCGIYYKAGYIKPEFVSGRFEDSYMIMDMLTQGYDIMIITGGCYRYLHREDSFINSPWDASKWCDYVRVQLKTLDTESRLFPERKQRIKKDLSMIRYNLRYLKFKRRDDSSFGRPLLWFDSHIPTTTFIMSGFAKMIIKSFISLFR